jgi:hypothetical protein
MIIFGCVFNKEEFGIASIQGEWEWVDSRGGIAGITLTPDSAGYGPRTLIILGSEITLYQGDSIIFSEPYTLKMIRNRPAFEFNDSYPLPMYIDIIHGEKDTLMLTEICVDCFSHRFIRK